MDHDFNLPWYKIIPIEYMILEFKDNISVQDQESSHCSYRDVNFTIGGTDNDFYQEYLDIQVEEDVSSILNDTILSEYNS